MKIVPRSKVIYSFSPQHRPAERVKLGELVLLQTEDAFGGQVKDEGDSMDTLDWSRVDGAVGPIFVENARLGDTLAVEILDIKVGQKGVTVTVPKQGVLAGRSFKPSTKIVEIGEDYFDFEAGVRVKANPMIGTIGATPKKEISTGSLGRHGGNMDVKELTAGTTLYLPVFVEGALFAAGDLHVVQADGELSVSAVEAAGEILLRFGLISGKEPAWPVLETRDSYAFLVCGETLDEAVEYATEAAVEALMREHSWSFEKAYMFGSIAVNLEINQAVDPKRGARAVILKDFITLESMLS